MENTPFVEFDYSQKPLIKATFTGVEANEENVLAYIEESHKCFDWERYALIYDISKLKYLPAKYRIMQGQALEENKDKIANQAIGLAIVAPSIIARTITKGVFLVKPYPSKHKVVKSMEEAETWIRGLIAEEESGQTQSN